LILIGRPICPPSGKYKEKFIIFLKTAAGYSVFKSIVLDYMPFLPGFSISVTAISGQPSAFRQAF
jgi:hypothetical protein